MFEDHQSPATQAKDEESGRCEQNRQHPVRKADTSNIDPTLDQREGYRDYRDRRSPKGLE
ncbi:hypothetical protein CPC08DRAFT_715857 [Agrocybe pediades]|nr:hypothetical protein CPC08DRAFT_715857 [Agrocybe pediades]